MRHFNEGRKNVYDDPWSSRPSVAHIIANKKKFKQTTSTRKIMCTVFWDRRGVLLMGFLPQGSTINAGVYCDTLKKLRRAIQNQRRGLLSRGVVMLHDNPHPYTAPTTQDLISTFGWEQFDHPPLQPRLRAK
jgi:hypothetical protein